MIARIRKSIEEKDEGFTLIELLVVIIIIGILAAIAIPVFLNQRKKAVDASQKSDLRTVANELETYFTDNQTYPAAQANQVGTMTIGADVITLSPGNTLGYALNGTATAYCITSENVKGSKAAGKYYVYVSSAGGLQASTVDACPAAY